MLKTWQITQNHQWKKNPDIVVLRVGTNSLGTNKPAEEIATEICDLAADLRNGTNEVVVSAIIFRGDDSTLNTKAKTVNEKLKTLCGENGLDFIEHQNIDATKHLNGSALHLKGMGAALFANNLIKYLKAQWRDDGLNIITQLSTFFLI